MSSNKTLLKTLPKATGNISSYMYISEYALIKEVTTERIYQMIREGKCAAYAHGQRIVIKIKSTPKPKTAHEKHPSR